MKLADSPSSMTNWSTVPASEHPGESGRATMRSRQLGEIQPHVRMEAKRRALEEIATRQRRSMVRAST
jgi:hypothetical protein